MPILGDAYILGNDLEKGFKNLTLKHGKICGLWLGPQRAVVVSDFEILQEMLNKPETSDRQIWAVAGNYHHNYFKIKSLFWDSDTFKSKGKSSLFKYFKSLNLMPTVYR